MDHVTSADGTTIAFDRSGDGLPVILVCGGSTDRTSNAGLAEVLSSNLTVYNYDRRGRGDSGDTPPYAVEREVEDIDAVVGAAGGSAFLYGTSSGAALAMKAAARLAGIAKLAMWEPPFVPEGRPRPPADTAKTYTELVGAGRRGDAVEYFMSKVVGLPPEFVAGARQAPFWAQQEALAHTLAYDATVMSDYSLPIERARSVKVPAIVIAGGADFSWMTETAETLAAAMPDGRYRRLEGQGHNVDPAVLAPVLVAFFNA
jgi:pimeloyl-ACP methyl ester carboxylesterase